MFIYAVNSNNYYSCLYVFVLRICLPIMPFEVTLYFNFIWSFLYPITLILSGQTNRQTHKQESSFTNIDVLMHNFDIIGNMYPLGFKKPTKL